MSETLKATISAAILVIANVALYVFGVQLDVDTMTQVAFSAAIAIVTIYGAWKNHNFTKAAQDGQQLTDLLKSGENAIIALVDEDGEIIEGKHVKED